MQKLPKDLFLHLVCWLGPHDLFQIERMNKMSLTILSLSTAVWKQCHERNCDPYLHRTSDHQQGMIYRDHLRNFVALEKKIGLPPLKLVESGPSLDINVCQKQEGGLSLAVKGRYKKLTCYTFDEQLILKSKNIMEAPLNMAFLTEDRLFMNYSSCKKMIFDIRKKKVFHIYNNPEYKKFNFDYIHPVSEEKLLVAISVTSSLSWNVPNLLQIFDVQMEKLVLVKKVEKGIRNIWSWKNLFVFDESLGDHSVLGDFRCVGPIFKWKHAMNPTMNGENVAYIDDFREKVCIQDHRKLAKNLQELHVKSCQAHPQLQFHGQTLCGINKEKIFRFQKDSRCQTWQRRSNLGQKVSCFEFANRFLIYQASSFTMCSSSQDRERSPSSCICFDGK